VLVGLTAELPRSGAEPVGDQLGTCAACLSKASARRGAAGRGDRCGFC